MLENQGKRSFKENPDAKFYKKQMITNNWEDWGNTGTLKSKILLILVTNEDKGIKVYSLQYKGNLQ